MLPWLMRLGPGAARFGRGLFGGTGWGKKARDIPGTSGVLGRGTRPIPGRPPPGVARRTRDVPEADIGLRTAGRETVPAGWARRHPKTSLAAGLGTAGVGTFTGYGLMAGDETPPIDPNRLTTPVQPWSAPEGMMSFAESEIARVEEGEQNFRKLMDFGMLIAATGGNAEKFFERGKWVLEQSDQYAQDKQYAKAVRAVYKEGDMPKSAREAYERLTPLMGPEKAAVLSGHQLGMETGKTKEERLWNKIISIAQTGDIESAARELVAAWGTNRLGGAPDYTDNNLRMEEARRLLQGVASGGAGYSEGVTDIALREASA